MILDVNAYLGHFAFRRLRNNTAASLLSLMDSRGSTRRSSPAPAPSPTATRRPAMRRWRRRSRGIAIGWFRLP